MQINTLAGNFSGLRFLFDQSKDPRHLIGVDDEHVSFRIVGRPTPLSSSIKSWEDDGAFLARRNELPITTNF